MAIYWIYLLLGIIFEVLGTVCMKMADGFTKLVPSILVFLFYGLCLVFLTLVFKKLDIGVTYAIWAGIGTALTAIIGFVYFQEPVTIVKISSIVLIIIGIMGLELF
ncbi:MAG: multidrug efflux SMR transporter [Bacteroidetes bacterium]|nr:multidrug efflux SMR transporter [Bacteroidota bacterium]